MLKEAMLQEALSKRYGNESLILTPLSNGHWAIFDRSFQFVDFVSCNMSIDWLRHKSIAAEKRLTVKPPSPRPETDLSEFVV